MDSSSDLDFEYLYLFEILFKKLLISVFLPIVLCQIYLIIISIRKKNIMKFRG